MGKSQRMCRKKAPAVPGFSMDTGVKVEQEDSAGSLHRSTLSGVQKRKKCSLGVLLTESAIDLSDSLGTCTARKHGGKALIKV